MNLLDQKFVRRARVFCVVLSRRLSVSGQVLGLNSCKACAIAEVLVMSAIDVYVLLDRDKKQIETLKQYAKSLNKLDQVTTAMEKITTKQVEREFAVFEIERANAANQSKVDQSFIVRRKLAASE